MPFRPHEFPHVFHIFRNAVPIVFARVVHPLDVVLVEFALVIGRKPARLLRESGYRNCKRIGKSNLG